jgi:YVTN family beta-propeller protein
VSFNRRKVGMTRLAVLAIATALVLVLGAVPSRAQNAYITNGGSGTVSVIATATNTVIGSPITVGSGPGGVAVTPDGSKVYVANLHDNTVSVVATATNTVINTISVGNLPLGVAVAPDGSKVYVTISLRTPSL